MTPATIARLRPLVFEAYWAAQTPNEERLVAILLAFIGEGDPYNGEHLAGTAWRTTS